MAKNIKAERRAIIAIKAYRKLLQAAEESDTPLQDILRFEGDKPLPSFMVLKRPPCIH
jgi:hypothetical protein